MRRFCARSAAPATTRRRALLRRRRRSSRRSASAAETLPKPQRSFSGAALVRGKRAREDPTRSCSGFLNNAPEDPAPLLGRVDEASRATRAATDLYLRYYWHAESRHDQPRQRDLGRGVLRRVCGLRQGARRPASTSCPTCRSRILLPRRLTSMRDWCAPGGTASSPLLCISRGPMR